VKTFAPPCRAEGICWFLACNGLARWILPIIGVAIFASGAFGQTQEVLPPPSALKKLSLEELMNIEVTSVSKSPEKLSETASAIQVITDEDIRRSGATRLPEALRLASNLEVAQVDSSQWAISARGFNSPLANKLLVLIDGRTVYSPLFAGVFWDHTDVFLEDVDRIEVISGPGATLWGANAVNGVINITTKDAKDTQGFLLEGGGGNELRGFGGVRYGGTIASNLYFRVYGKYSDRDSTILSSGVEATNDWHMGQGGFRSDWEPSDADVFTLQGDLYGSRESEPFTTDAALNGGNLLARWSHTFSDRSDFKLQWYFDRSHLDVPSAYNDRLDTYDIDFQHHFLLGERNDVVWGAGYRLVEDNFRPGSLALVPQRISLQTFSTFAQDQIAIVQKRLNLTLGTKIEHNDYTSFEFEPSARLAWRPGSEQTVWGAISRAVRTPSRIDRDLVIPPVTFGSPNFQSEAVIAYELGYRIELFKRLSLSVATYYNDYDRIRSEEQVNPPAPIPLVFGNGQKAESYGVELTGTYRVADFWRLSAAFTELQIHIWPAPGSTDKSAGGAEAADSNHHFSFRSSLDLPGNIEFDAEARYISKIINPTVATPGYAELTLRLAWHATHRLEFSVVGQNLLHAHHPEFGSPATRQEIERGVYGKVLWRF